MCLKRCVRMRDSHFAVVDLMTVKYPQFFWWLLSHSIPFQEF
jgi:hypothetical protein